MTCPILGSGVVIYPLSGATPRRWLRNWVLAEAMAAWASVVNQDVPRGVGELEEHPRLATFTLIGFSCSVRSPGSTDRPNRALTVQSYVQ